MLVTGTVLVIVGLVGWLWMATRSLAHRRAAREALVLERLATSSPRLHHARAGTQQRSR